MRISANDTGAEAAFAGLCAELAVAAARGGPTNDEVLQQALQHPYVKKYAHPDPATPPAPKPQPVEPPQPQPRAKTRQPAKTKTQPAQPAQPAPGPVPDWLSSMSDTNRQAYFAAHPDSKWRGVQVENHLKQNPQHASHVQKFLNRLTGRGSALGEQAQKRVQPQHITPKKKAKIASWLRSALASHSLARGEEKKTKGKAAPTPNRKRADYAGFKAAVTTMAACGLLTVGGVGLHALGIPLACFTPHLIKHVYKTIRPSPNNDTLVKNFCHAIRNALTLGIGKKKREESLIKLKKTSKSKADTPTINGKPTGDTTQTPDTTPSNAGDPPPAPRPMPRPAPLGLGDPFGNMFSQPRKNPIPPGS